MRATILARTLSMLIGAIGADVTLLITFSLSAAKLNLRYLATGALKESHRTFN